MPSSNPFRSICVFCGSSEGAKPAYLEAATATGTLLAQRGIRVVYGGASIGLMGATADAALAAGGKVTGIIPDFLAQKEITHPGVAEMLITASMHTRKRLMHRRSDAFICLPGGFGTFEELTEILTWAQLGLHRKPIGLLNVAGYYDPFLHFLDHAVTEGFVRPHHRQLVLSETSPEALLQAFEAYTPPEPLIRWMDEEMDT